MNGADLQSIFSVFKLYCNILRKCKYMYTLYLYVNLSGYILDHKIEVFRTTFIETFVERQVSSDAQTGTVRIILKDDLLLSSRER